MLQHCMYLVIIYSTLFHHICTCSYLRLLLCFVISHSIYIFFLMLSLIFFFFFFKDTYTPEIYTSLHTLSLPDALPIWSRGSPAKRRSPKPSRSARLRKPRRRQRRTSGASALNRRGSSEKRPRLLFVRVRPSVRLPPRAVLPVLPPGCPDRKSTRLNSSH